MVSWLHRCEPKVRQRVMADRVWWGRAAHLMVGEKERWGAGEEKKRSRNKM